MVFSIENIAQGFCATILLSRMRHDVYAKKWRNDTPNYQWLGELCFCQKFTAILFKVHIFWEGHKLLRNLHRRFDRYYIGQIYGGDFSKFCSLLRIYELYRCYPCCSLEIWKSSGSYQLGNWKPCHL